MGRRFHRPRGHRVREGRLLASDFIDGDCPSVLLFDRVISKARPASVHRGCGGERLDLRESIVGDEPALRKGRRPTEDGRDTPDGGQALVQS